MGYEKIVLDVEIYETNVKNIETVGKSLLEDTDCYEPTERCAKNAVVPDYVAAYDGMIKAINNLMAVNGQVVTLMDNVLKYHKKIDQEKSDQLKLASDVFG